MERLILPALLALSLMIPPAFADNESPAHEFSFLSMEEFVPNESGISIFRYGAFGAGMYPYCAVVPGKTYEIRIDGVPEAPLSPFGSDLERIPPLLMDSLSVSGNAMMAVATRDSLTVQPLTRIDFLTGVHRRFRFQGVFERRISERSGIRVFGMSDGIRGGETTGGNGLRLYGLTWRRTLTANTTARVTVSGSRERDDLFDLSDRKRMGEREADEKLASVRIVSRGVVKNGLFSSTAYVRNGIARFRRYGRSLSFADDSFGGAVNLTLGKPGARYFLDVYHDTRTIDERSGSISWSNSVTRVHGRSERTIGSASLNLNGEISYSSRYGAGYDTEGRLEHPLFGRWTVILGSSVSREFPGPHHELYPSLTFTDSLFETRLHRYRMFEMETGVKNNLGPVEIGCYGFTGQAEIPFFLPPPELLQMSGSERYTGWRSTISARGGDRVIYRADMRMDYTGGPGKRYAWPRPSLELLARGNLSRPFFSDALITSLHGKAHIVRWQDRPSTPNGTLALLDAGISARVSSLLFTYTIENIANRDMRWFDAFGWQGRNAYWGICWSLQN